MSQDAQLEKGYEPRDVEARWYEFWEKEGLFAADPQKGGPAYSIVIPPPNVTGVLHMGHALNVTLQDILCRFHRSKGYNVLWMPGTDHAGIATQNVVERKLAEEGTSRHNLGREAFIERVWEWRKQYGGAIISQLKRMGAMCDWSRERFTMDAGLSKAVRRVFVDLYNEGLIYRGDYIINWCPRCHTALADLEVEHEELDGHLYHIRYPFESGKGGPVVATTRPETMLGDTAVAVNPKDSRYTNAVGKNVILPLMNRAIPVIADDYVDPSFGTGALKVTPAHDPNDFTLGTRHDLPYVKVIGDDGRMTEDAGAYAGLDRYECRKKVVEDLKAAGLLVKIEPHRHGVGHCYRCKTVVEPNLSKQWFVKAGPLAEAALKVVKDGKIRIVPEIWTKNYYDWLENIRDWCISRQIWWGHRIPAWTCESCGELSVSMEDLTQCPSCGKDTVTQDSDVLDTWFSSALWPFSTMGWPDDTPEMKTYYPTAVLVTGFDILFFWVARMVMMGLHFAGDVPFKDVYIHALVRDAEGKKMSKSKGNVIDPVEVIDTYGTDAFRFTLAAFAAQGRDIKMDLKRVDGYRHFINKLWNAARFVLSHLAAHPEAATATPAPQTLCDCWILSRLSRLITDVSESLNAYHFNEAAGALYRFTWHELCDWYLEAIKPVLYDKEGIYDKAATVTVLARVFKDLLVLLHPFIPFVTEEIWQKFPGTDGSIMNAAYPASTDPESGLVPDPEAEADMEIVMGVITAVRNIRGEMNIPPGAALTVAVHATDEMAVEVLSEQDGIIKALAKIADLDVGLERERPKGAAFAAVSGHGVYVMLEGVIDLTKEIDRLSKEIGKLTKELVGMNKKLSSEDFLGKAPKNIVEKVRAEQEEILQKVERLETTMGKLTALSKG